MYVPNIEVTPDGDGMRADVDALVEMYAAAIATKGVTPEGIFWPNAEDLAARFEVLLSSVDFEAYSPESRLKLLDLGCGPGFLLDYLSDQGLLESVDYCGVDVTESTMKYARTRWPGQRFELRDIREHPFPQGTFDVAIICGVFTTKFGIAYETMERFVKSTLEAAWPAVRSGLSFNVMSKHVDWERDDLFHWPLDDIMAFCKASLSRHVGVRADYGLWEVSVFVRRDAVARKSGVPAAWLTGAR